MFCFFYMSVLVKKSFLKLNFLSILKKTFTIKKAEKKIEVQGDKTLYFRMILGIF